jgi:hypothetical protein
VKVTIDGREVPGVRAGDWTFEEALKVKELTGLRVGEVFEEHLRGDAAVALAFGIVGEMRLGNAPELLRTRGVDSIVIDFSEPKEDDGPPDEAAPARRGSRSGAQRSPRRS